METPPRKPTPENPPPAPKRPTRPKPKDELLKTDL